MLRVVNTLLTQIDRLKSFSNILILTTSNLIEIIDQALTAHLKILDYSCLQEKEKTKLWLSVDIATLSI